MVWMNEWDQKHYPAPTTFVRDELADHVRNDPRVRRAFLRHSQLSEAGAPVALRWGTLPVLDVCVLFGDNGRFRRSRPDEILIDDTIVRRFERDHALAEARLLIESTVLHEMVHWGDETDGVDQAGEEGKKFEREAYGRDVRRYW